MRGGQGEQFTLDLDLAPEVGELDQQWTSAAENEKASRSRYAQVSIRPSEVAREVDEARSRLGRPDDVERFVRTALTDVGGSLETRPDGLLLHSHSVPVGLRDVLRAPATLAWVRDLPAPRGAAVMVRTDERVGALARFVLDGALDPRLDEHLRPARRAGVVTTADVSAVTVLLLARFRIHVTLPGRHSARTEVAEEARTLAFRGVPAHPTWLDPDEVTALMNAHPTANTPPDRARAMIDGVLAALPQLTPELEAEAYRAAGELQDAHSRVRQAARGRETAGALTVRGLSVEPQLPVDLLGVFVFLPGGAA